MTSSLLFDPSLLGNTVASKLPDGYVIRPLAVEDYDKGYLACLEQLAAVGTVSREQFTQQFQRMQRQQCSYVTVIEDTRRARIVASGTLVVEYKFLRGCSHAGHIEDVVVDSEQRGTGLGARIVEQLKELAITLGCYKLILNCTEKNAGFYERCGLKRQDIQMKLYLNQPATQQTTLQTAETSVEGSHVAEKLSELTLNQSEPNVAIEQATS